MSGDDFRAAAKQGDWRAVKHMIKNKTNTCSQDEFGLTALHYSVWNGHLECVKYLVCNTFGVDRYGNKATSLDMTSCKGYTALHLAALDTPSWVSKEITMLLLTAGADKSILDNDGKTCEDLLDVYDNAGSREAFQEFSLQDEDPEAKGRVDVVKRSLEKYCYPLDPIIGVNVDSWKVNFEIPEFLSENERVGSLPDGMMIHEHHLKPMVDEGEEKFGIEAFKLLDFSTEQAKINQDRREKLLLARGDDWQPVDAEKLNEDKKMSAFGLRRSTNKRQPDI